MVLGWLLACTPPSDPTGDRVPVDTRTSAEDTGPDGVTGDTAATVAEPAAPVDCSLLLSPQEIDWSYTPGIDTEEDFDFDGEGGLLTQRGTALQSIDRDGGSRIVAPADGVDPTGIRSTADGFVVTAQPSQGVIWRINPASGASTRLLTGLTNPNGIEAGEDGMVYVTEHTAVGRVLMVDPIYGTIRTVASSVENPNGVVLSPDEQTLYFTSSGNAPSGESRIMAVDRGADESWDPSTLREIHSRFQEVVSITMDACGNLYGVEFGTGRVFRLDPNDGRDEVIAALPDASYYSAIHFSPGLGGWDVTALYVSNRSELFEIPTGVPGSHVLTP